MNADLPLSVRNEPASPTGGIQEAIDALPPSGGVVCLPAGEYRLRRSVVLRSNMTLRGAGEATRVVREAVFTVPLARDTEAPANVVELSRPAPVRTGDHLLLREPYPEPTDGKGVRWGFNCRYLAVEEVVGNLLRCASHYGPDDLHYRVKHRAAVSNEFPALVIAKAAGVTIEGLTIQGTYAVPENDPWAELKPEFMAAAINIKDAPQVRVLNVTVRHWPSDGICISSKSTDALVQGCVVENCMGIGFHPGGGLGGARIVNNVSRGNTIGLLFCMRNRHVVVSGNHFHHNRTDGIHGLGEPDRYCTVTHNAIHDNGRYGIEANGAYGCVIQGNIVRNNSQSRPGLFAGIYLEKHQHNVVTGNLCLDNQDRPTQVLGLACLNPAGPNIIENNHAPHVSTIEYAWDWLRKEKESIQARLNGDAAPQ